jgi:hypothetical protein
MLTVPMLNVSFEKCVLVAVGVLLLAAHEV